MSEFLNVPDREHSFRSIYEAAYPDLLRFVQRRAGPEHAEDMVAEAFTVVWRRLPDLPHDHDDARAWIFGIARNILLNNHRSEQRRIALGVRLANAAMIQSVETVTDEVVARVDLGKAWLRLSETHQEALALTVFEELNALQAATVLGISPVAFRLRLSRARRALRLHLDYFPKLVIGPTRNAAERTTTP